MPQVAGTRYPYDARGQAAAAQARRKRKRPLSTSASARGGGLPPNPKPGAPPPAAPSILGVAPMPQGGPPKSTLPPRGNVGFKGAGGKMRKFDPALVERLRKRLGKQAKGQGAYNLLHTKGKPSDALTKLREAKNRKAKFGGPDEGRPVVGSATAQSRGKRRKKASFGSASSV